MTAEDLGYTARYEAWMKSLLDELEAELPAMQWTSAGHGDKVPAMVHHTGRGPKWVVQLVCLDDGQRLGAATAGTTMLKLTDALCLKASEVASKAWLKEEEEGK